MQQLEQVVGILLPLLAFTVRQSCKQLQRLIIARACCIQQGYSLLRAEHTSWQHQLWFRAAASIYMGYVLPYLSLSAPLLLLAVLCRNSMMTCAEFGDKKRSNVCCQHSVSSAVVLCDHCCTVKTLQIW
jgi:hypothetical protein